MIIEKTVEISQLSEGMRRPTGDYRDMKSAMKSVGAVREIVGVFRSPS